MSWAASNHGTKAALCYCQVCSLLLLIFGCSKPDVGTVAGRVTLDGQPLSTGTIVFEDAKRGISVNAALASDGTYTARTYDKPGLSPGSYQVAIRPGLVGSGEAPLVGDADSSSGASVSTIPQRYRSVRTSELTADVQLGDNRPFDFALTSEP